MTVNIRPRTGRTRRFIAMRPWYATPAKAIPATLRLSGRSMKTITLISPRLLILVAKASHLILIAAIASRPLSITAALTEPPVLVTPVTVYIRPL